MSTSGRFFDTSNPRAMNRPPAPSAKAQGLAGRLELHPTAGVVEGLRMLKDAAELDAMRLAIDLTDQVMDAVLP